MKEEPKQETLEEAAEKLARAFDNGNYKALIQLVEDGAKWQQEQDKNKYSEEDMIEYSDYVWNFSNSNRYKSSLQPNEWFKQLKNK